MLHLFCKKIPKFQIKTFLVFCEIQRTEKKRYLLIIVIGVKDNCLFRYVLQNDTPHRISYDVFVKFLAIYLNHFLLSLKENNNWIPRYWNWKLGLNVNIFYNIRISNVVNKSQGWKQLFILHACIASHNLHNIYITHHYL